MISKVLFVCLLGLAVQNAHSWYEKGRLSELGEVQLSNNPVYMGGYRHQLNCIGEEYLCQKYAQDPIYCKIKGIENKNINWHCNYNNYKNAHVALDQEKSIITYETPENKTYDDEIYTGSLVLNYTLRFKGQRLSQLQSITLKEGEKTQGYKPVQQLNCQTLDLCSLYAPANVTCTNLFNSTGQFRWRCDAKLPSFLGLDELDIACERRRNADFDDEIVLDSCSLSYKLKAKTQSLTGITELTFVKGKTTSGVHPINELTCLEDKHFRNLCDLYELERVTCRNFGTEQGDVQWKCKANLPSNIQLIKPEVTCEKADNQANSNIIVGSCGLTYSLRAIV